MCFLKALYIQAKYLHVLVKGLQEQKYYWSAQKATNGVPFQAGPNKQYSCQHYCQTSIGQQTVNYQLKAM